MKTMSMEEQKIYTFLGLTQLKGFGKKSLQRFYAWTCTQEVDWTLTQKMHIYIAMALKNTARLHIPSQKKIDEAFIVGQRIVEDCKKNNISIIPKWSDFYPKRMVHIKDSPLFLYLKGNLLSIHARHSVAIVGTRTPSSLGRQAATRYGLLFAQQNFAIVSGLALGCDTAAHNGCLKHENGLTIAILAHGLAQKIYPPQNISLAQRILEAKGALLSEYPPHTPMYKHTFVERDRWQAALSDGVIVVETTKKGGTMHTIRFTKELQKPLACFYSDTLSWNSLPQAQKNIELIEEGYFRLSSKEEIHQFIHLLK